MKLINKILFTNIVDYKRCLNSNFEWKLVNSVTGQTTITLPEFNELLICVDNGNQVMTGIIPKVILTDMVKQHVLSGGRISNIYGIWVDVKISKTQCSLYRVFADDNDNTNTSTMTVHYR